MNIEQLNERVAKKQYKYNNIVRRRALVRTPETITRMDKYMILRKARLVKAIENRQDLLDNPKQRYWQPETKLYSEKTIYSSASQFISPFQARSGHGSQCNHI